MIATTRRLLLGVHFALATVLGLLLSLARPFHPSNSRLCARLYGSLALPIIGLRVRVEGSEHFPRDRPFVVVANHQSNWDLFVVGQAVPARTVSVGKRSLKWIPLFGQLYWLSGNVLIDRGNHQRAMQAMEATKRALRERHTNIWFFAEGTRNHGKNMLPFRKGAFMTAIHAGVPIVPVCTGPYLRDFSLARRDNDTTTIRVLPPLETAQLGDADAEQLMQDCHDRMLAVIQSL